MMKHAAADAKEKLGNVTAKVEEKMDKAKASATEKSDKAMAHDKVGKLEAKERKHEREAKAEQEKDLKQVTQSIYSNRQFCCCQKCDTQVVLPSKN